MQADPFVSYAQTMEDVMLWRALREVGPGFYIDVGAADPDRLSVTRAFYERGWRGLDIEPLPEQADRLRRARPRDVVVEAALSDASGTATFHRVRLQGDFGLSTLDPEAAASSGGTIERLKVPVTTLAALCREHVQGEVHFLKIDVEGAEAAVLRGADFDAARPWIILIEATRPGSGEAAEEDWERRLLDSGYVFVWFDGLNRFYLAQEHHAALQRHFQVPPNPFDNYKIADLATEELLTATKLLAEDRLALIRSLEGELRSARDAPPPPATPPPPAPTPPATFARLPPAPPRPAPFAYRLVRPVVRPVARRLKMFLVGELRDRLIVLHDRQQLVLDQLEAIRSKPALDDELAQAVERLLITLSLRQQRPD